MTQLLDYPKLPLLPMDRCLAVFKRANINAVQFSKISGFTRMALYTWEKGKITNVRPHSRDRVSVLAYRCLRALRAKKAPFRDRCPVDEILVALGDEAAGRSLAQYTPEELLPPQWLNPTTKA